jgi:predicted ArsR family transcriptional regulator
MNRKDFMKTCAVACAVGFCDGADGQAKNDAQVPRACEVKEMEDTQARAIAARLRYAKLIEILEEELPQEQRTEILHALGGNCANTYRGTLIDRYKGDIKGFLEEIRRSWGTEATYDEVNRLIRVVDKGPNCACPMVQVGTTPPSFCDCTLGWQESAYSTVLGRPVKAELEQSILRGGKKCIYRIHVL